MQNGTTFEILSNGDLKISLTDDGKAWLAENSGMGKEFSTFNFII